MSDEPLNPPANLPTEIVNTLNESDPEQLRDIKRADSVGQPMVVQTTVVEATVEKK